MILSGIGADMISSGGLIGLPLEEEKGSISSLFRTIRTSFNPWCNTKTEVPPIKVGTIFIKLNIKLFLCL